ncbi:MAG: hypothetical protein ABI411_17320 [Tahibacter sp.]
MKSLHTLLLTASLALALGACGKQAPPPPPPAPTPAPAPAPAPTPPPPAPAGVTVRSVVIGNTVGADQNVTAAMTSFGPKDTIYASVATNGSAASANIAAKWTYQDGQTINDSNQTIAPNGPAVTTFHIAKPDGWPAGKYTVAISLDGKPAGSASFDVK